MAKVVLTNELTVTVNTVDLSDHIAAFTVSVTAEERDSSSFDDEFRQRLTGLKDGSVSISFHTDYAAAKTNATLGPLLGSYATVVASGTLGGTATSGTAVALVTSLTPIGGAIGDLMVQDVTWPTHGSVTGWGL